MSIGDETRLRSELSGALDEFSPGPLPLDAVIRQGRATVLHKRVLAAVAVALVVVAAVTLPKLAHQLTQPPAPVAPLRYHVNVYPPGIGSPKGLVASGSVNKLHWSAEVTYSGGNTNECWHLRGESGYGCNGTGGYPSFPAQPVDSFGAEGNGPVMLLSAVRADVRYLIVSLSNGETVKLLPVAVLGEKHPRYVAIVVPTVTSITQVSAYSEHNEIAYAVPFGTRALPPPSTFNFDLNSRGIFQVVRWLKPGQPALPLVAIHRFGYGTVNGSSWSQYVATGPFGTCVLSVTSSYPFCFPVDAVDLIRHAAAKTLTSAAISGQGLDWVTIVAKPSVSYLMATGRHGRLIKVGLYSAGGVKFATIASTRRNGITGWIAYSAGGTVLATGQIG
jgi:hypothetical protein